MDKIKKKISGKNTIYAKDRYWDWNPVYKIYKPRNEKKLGEALTWADIGER